MSTAGRKEVKPAQRGGLRVLVFEQLEQAGCVCALSTVPLNVRVDDDRDQFVRALGAGRFATTQQVHHADIAVADVDVVPDADGLVTDDAGLALLMRAADCSLVVVADPGRRVLGMAHAGWKGSARGVVVNLVRSLEQRYGTRPGDCLAAIGPTIGIERFEVGPEVPAAFVAKRGWAKEYVKTRGKKFSFDLRAANRQFLIESGIDPDAIEMSDTCTYDTPDLLHSYRREGVGAGHQGMLAYWPAEE